MEGEQEVNGKPNLNEEELLKKAEQAIAESEDLFSLLTEKGIAYVRTESEKWIDKKEHPIYRAVMEETIYETQDVGWDKEGMPIEAEVEVEPWVYPVDLAFDQEGNFIEWYFLDDDPLPAQLKKKEQQG